jgi:hypothetical protein
MFDVIVEAANIFHLMCFLVQVPYILFSWSWMDDAQKDLVGDWTRFSTSSMGSLDAARYHFQRLDFAMNVT